MAFRKIQTKIDGVFIIEPDVFRDDRGYFMETYNEKAFKEIGITNKFVQDNQSMSAYGTIRGLHVQLGKYSQAKLVRALSGTVLDVAVDVRRGSPTFGQYVAVELSAENQRQLFIPRYLAHGFSVLSDYAIFAYKCDNGYYKPAEFGLNCFDKTINVDWKIPASKAILSEKDKNAPCLGDFMKKVNLREYE
ncbi:MAG: dTDP-4-dehydrorhamnose 3,5-epimerase [Alphaproteobacteria bacterium]|nr:dTDP-4-dehydrorhamnose 3,5-epimerase [Alphaproteobacteria bacterium]